jgi:hypothetical protein
LAGGAGDVLEASRDHYHHALKQFNQIENGVPAMLSGLGDRLVKLSSGTLSMGSRFRGNDGFQANERRISA